MPRHNPIAQLVVEGKEDQHVIWALCGAHELPQTFRVVTPGEGSGGVEDLLCSIPVRLKMAGLQALGLVLDADQNLQSRWDAVCHRLHQAGYDKLPAQPHPQGTVIGGDERARVGVWLMPNNQLPGILEDFVAHLIPQHDPLLPKAESILADIEQHNLHRYKQAYHPKALIHTWLAWQNIPGRPMGQSITAHALLHDAAIAVSFVNWLNRLFVEVE
jgi:hypothetical protein